MNQFWNYEDIFGRADAAHLNRTTLEFLELVSDIRHRLGRQAYLLDKYISTFLEAVRDPLLCSAAKSGYDATGELNGLCRSVMDGRDDFTAHPMYEKVREYIGAHPLGYQESTTKQSLYCIALAGDYLSFSAEQYFQQQEKKQSEVFDIHYLHDLFRRISAAVGGDEQMERLNLLLRHRFLIVTPMAAFLQGLTDDLLYCLTHSDIETGQLAMRLWLDEQAPASENRLSDDADAVKHKIGNLHTKN